MCRWHLMRGIALPSNMCGIYVALMAGSIIHIRCLYLGITCAMKPQAVFTPKFFFYVLIYCNCTLNCLSYIRILKNNSSGQSSGQSHDSSRIASGIVLWHQEVASGPFCLLVNCPWCIIFGDRVVLNPTQAYYEVSTE